MAVEVLIHKMSEHMEFGTLVRWLVAEGERVERRQVIMEVETDKVVAEACRSYGPTGEWGMVVMEQAFDYLQAPVVRVTGRHSPIPFADSIEKGVWPETEDVVGAVRRVMEW